MYDMSEPKFKIGDTVVLKPFSELTSDELAITAAVRGYFNDVVYSTSFETLIEKLKKTHDLKQGTVKQVLAKTKWETYKNDAIFTGPSYYIEFSIINWYVHDSPISHYFPEFLLEPKINLTPETDKVFRDIIRDI
jgi:hypothetical protein